MATLRKRKKDGKWFLDYRDIDGERHRIDTGSRSKEDADLWVAKIEELTAQVRLGLREKIGKITADIVAGKKIEKPVFTLRDFKSKYQERCRHDLEHSEGTIELAGNAFDSFISIAGNKDISTLSDEDVIGWKRTQTLRGLSKSTLSIYHRALRAAFNRAIKWNFAKDNPFVRVEVSKGRKNGPGEKDMDLEEVKLILRKIDEAGDYQYALFVRILVFTGCRRNEILFLRWENIDLKNLTLKIKADKTSRTLLLPINKALKRTLREEDFKEKGYVFQTNSGSRRAKFKDQPWHESYVSHSFKRYVREAGLSENYSVHSLRHTYATHLLQRGVPMTIVQKLLGHASVRTTDTYDHSIALHFREQADLMDLET
jgi:integrase